MLLSQSPWLSVITRAPAAPMVQAMQMAPVPMASAPLPSASLPSASLPSASLSSAPVPESAVEDGAADLDQDVEDLPHDPTRPRGWLVSEKGLETIFRPELGAFVDVPPKRRPVRRVGRLLDC